MSAYNPKRTSASSRLASGGGVEASTLIHFSGIWVIGYVRSSCCAEILPAFCFVMRWWGEAYIRKIIPSDYATIVRDYARGNMDQAELWEELTALGYGSSEIEWHIANPGRRLEVRGSQLDEELKDLFVGAIGNFPPGRQDGAQRWLKERVVLY